MEFSSAWRELKAAHEAAGSPMMRCLRQPADADTLAIHGIRPDSDLGQMYSMADGVNRQAWEHYASPGYVTELYPSGPEFTSLEECRETAARMRSVALEADLGEQWWRDEWKLAWPMDDTAHALVLHPGDAGPGLVEVWWEAGPPRPVQASLPDLLAFGARRFALVDAQWDADRGLMDFDMDRYLRFPELP